VTVPTGTLQWSDQGTKDWQASHAYVYGQVIVDTNGRWQQCQSFGTSAASAPIWNTTPFGTTNDGTLTWTQFPVSAVANWAPSTNYSSLFGGAYVVDSNNNVELCIVSGLSATVQPTWNVGSTTFDGAPTLVWKDQGTTDIGRWLPNWTYVPGQTIVDPAGHTQMTPHIPATNSGVSGATEPAWNDAGGTTSDGTVTWQDMGVAVVAPPVDFVRNNWPTLMFARRGSGDMVFAFSGSRVSGEPRVSYCTFDGTTFGTSIVFPGQTVSGVEYSLLSTVASGGVTYFLLRTDGADVGGKGITSYTLSSGGTLSAGVVITMQDASQSGSNGTASQIIAFNDGTNDRVGFVCNTNEDPPTDTTIALRLFSAVAGLSLTWQTEVILSGSYTGYQYIYPDNTYNTPISVAMAANGTSLALTWIWSENFQSHGPYHVYGTTRVAGTWALPALLTTQPTWSGFDFNCPQIFAFTMTGGVGVIIAWQDENVSYNYSTEFVLMPLGVFSISCGSPPNGTLGVFYTHTFPTVGGTAPLTFAIDPSLLPPGITLNTATGTVSGVPV
jgi:hypothetical protein